MDWTESLRTVARRFSSNAKATVDEVVGEFCDKGVGGAFRETLVDAGDALKEFGETASGTISKGLSATTAWITGDPHEEVGKENPAVRSPLQPELPPRLEDLRKGDKVFRKGQPATIVKVDYEVDPPALVVRMLEDGREVGTTGAHVTLSLEASMRCLQRGIRVCMLGLQTRPELNLARGTIVSFRADLNRWNVKMVSNGDLFCVRSHNMSVLLTGAEEEEVGLPAAYDAQEDVKAAGEATSTGSAEMTVPCTQQEVDTAVDGRTQEVGLPAAQNAQEDVKAAGDATSKGSAEIAVASARQDVDKAVDGRMEEVGLSAAQNAQEDAEAASEATSKCSAEIAVSSARQDVDKAVDGRMEKESPTGAVASAAVVSTATSGSAPAESPTGAVASAAVVSTATSGSAPADATDLLDEAKPN
eukprot:TRINITY_DN6075_c0_g1_i1.p1 TRINITY_DN6075_c0_g1~~TRINITY_DN6075_c0_g1_i1.p1  ORF type:complete len:417 (+),score=80.48 TRINITY_DN6075_c0_g1_i1:108-1358(+)